MNTTSKYILPMLAIAGSVVLSACSSQPARVVEVHDVTVTHKPATTTTKTVVVKPKSPPPPWAYPAVNSYDHEKE
jgi:hypothetical protein